jgi:hypothetical protein
MYYFLKILPVKLYGIDIINLGRLTLNASVESWACMLCFLLNFKHFLPIGRHISQICTELI